MLLCGTKNMIYIWHETFSQHFLLCRSFVVLSLTVNERDLGKGGMRGERISLQFTHNSKASNCNKSTFGIGIFRAPHGAGWQGAHRCTLSSFSVIVLPFSPRFSFLSALLLSVSFSSISFVFSLGAKLNFWCQPKICGRSKLKRARSRVAWRWRTKNFHRTPSRKHLSFAEKFAFRKVCCWRYFFCFHSYILLLSATLAARPSAVMR